VTSSLYLLIAQESVSEFVGGGDRFFEQGAGASVPLKKRRGGGYFKIIIRKVGPTRSKKTISKNGGKGATEEVPGHK